MVSPIENAPVRPPKDWDFDEDAAKCRFKYRTDVVVLWNPYSTHSTTNRCLFLVQNVSLVRTILAAGQPDRWLILGIQNQILLLIYFSAFSLFSLGAWLCSKFRVHPPLLWYQYMDKSRQ
jgi:hypothetical protein